jgi:multiple antibiotic resistance protein
MNIPTEDPLNIATEVVAYLLSTVGALIPVVNPFSTAPMVVSMTMSMPDTERAAQIRRGCIYMFCILTAFVAAGSLIMSFFGISIPGLRIAGGLVIAFVGFRMLFPGQEASDAGPNTNTATRDISFSPLAMPSLAGPGSIAVVIGMSSTAHASSFVFLRHALIVLGIALTAVFCWVVLRAATKFSKYLGTNGVHALTGIMGFLLVCIGVQFVINGVSHLHDG